jgi:hypothetical protein
VPTALWPTPTSRTSSPGRPVAKAELAITEKKFEARSLFQQARELNPHDPEAKAGSTWCRSSRTAN